MKTTVENILGYIDQFAPFASSEPWDNSGLLVGKKDQVVSNILLSLDITEDVVHEAISKKIDLIITHHPILFSGIKSIVDHSRIGSLLLKLIENRISVIAAHTNLDRSFEYGINAYISELFGLQNVQVLDDKLGFGIIGNFTESISLHELSHITKSVFKIEHIKCANSTNESMYRKIAISSGASSDYIQDAILKHADAFITSDIKYHEAQLALGSSMTIVDVGHFESEILYLIRFSELLTLKIKSNQSSVNVFITESEKPIFKYL